MDAYGIIRRWTKIHPIVRLTSLSAGVTGLGISLALLLVSPFRELITSVVVTLLSLLLIAADPLKGLLIWLVGYPFTDIAINIRLGRGIPDLSLARLCVGFLLTLILAQIATGRRKGYSITRVEVAFLLFVVGFGASMAGTKTTSAMLQWLFDHWVMPLIVYFVIKNLVTDRRTLDRTLNALLIIGAYSAIYMLYELKTGNVLFLSSYTDYYYYRGTSIRIVRGLYGTTLTYGLLFNWLLPIAVHYFLKAPTLARKGMYGLIMGLMLVGDFLTYKRTMWVALLVSFLIIQQFYRQFRRFFVVITLLFAVVLAFTWGSFSQSELATERALNETQWRTANGRIDRWAAGWALWKQKPLFGHGFREFNDITGWGGGVENDYLHILVSSGLVGFVPYIAFYIFILLDSIRVYRQMGVNRGLFIDRDLMIVFWGLYSTYFVTAMSGSGNDGHPIANFVFLATMGAIVGSQVPRLAQSKRGENRMLALLHVDGN